MQMNGYSWLERSIGKYLDGFPTIRYALKTSYQFANYILNKAAYLGYLGRESSLTLNKHVALSGRFVLPSHFFGYYDKSPWSENGKKILFHQSENNCVSIQCASTDGTNQIIKISELSAWN